MSSHSLSTPGKETSRFNGFLTDSVEANNTRLLNSSLQAGILLLFIILYI
jgi:hypothetical protein